jgi:hypothetical protein
MVYAPCHIDINMNIFLILFLRSSFTSACGVCRQQKRTPVVNVYGVWCMVYIHKTGEPTGKYYLFSDIGFKSAVYIE